jgi:hypothetical protein
MTTKTVEILFPELGTPTAPVPTSSPPAIFSIRVCVCVRACEPHSLWARKTKENAEKICNCSPLSTKLKTRRKLRQISFTGSRKKIINLLCFPPRRFPCTLATIPSHSCDKKRSEIRRRRCSRECVATNTKRDEHHRRLGSCGVLGRFQ